MNNGYTQLFRSNPSEEQQEAFINVLSVRINIFLEIKYGNIDLDLPSEPQLMNLSQPKDRGVISNVKFERLKAIVLNKSQENKNIDFNK